MKIDKFIGQEGSWLRGIGPFADITISSRIRLARNIADFPFPAKSKLADSEKIVSLIENSLKNNLSLNKILFIRIDKLPELDRLLLVERHLISHEHAVKKGIRAAFIDEEEHLSIMVCEEDHLRIQIINSGLQLFSSWSHANRIDDELEKCLTYAFSTSCGYLTSCPTNVGTGLRASVMLHLPALVMSKNINKILKAVSQLGLNIRGLYGEGSELKGSFFQISNQLTLGLREEQIIDDVEKVVRQIIGHEQNARKTLLKGSLYEIEDKIYRAYAVLKSARLITSNEAIELFSIVRLGIETGIIKDIKIAVLNKLFIFTQPAHLQKKYGIKMDSSTRDIKRAELIRQELNK